MQYYTHSHIAKPFLPKQGLYVACGIENQHFISPPPYIQYYCLSHDCLSGLDYSDFNIILTQNALSHVQHGDICRCANAFGMPFASFAHS